MATKEMTVAYCHNETCRHHWTPRKQNVPTRCPRCQSTNIELTNLEVNT